MSRILFPDASTSSSLSNSSFKAEYRPGKIPIASGSRPTPMKRSDSIISLPSPPSERRLLQSSLLPSQSTTSIASEEDRMQLDDDDDDDRLGIRSNHITNPFLLLASRGNERDPINSVPDHPQSSPTQLARRNRNKRIDRDRILLGPPMVVEEEKLEEVRLKDGMGLGWNDPNNPFIAKEGETINWKQGQAERPEKMTYVFRGKRITYDIPLSTFLSPDDPSESPFPIPSPRLLFPSEPTTPPSSVNPSSSFLDALRGSRDMLSPVKKTREVDHGLPTPVREGRKKLSRGGGGDHFSPYKRY